MNSKIDEIKIAEVLMRLARERGLSLREIARGTKEKTGVSISVSVLSDWTAGRQPKDFKKLKSVASFFGTSLHYLLYGCEETHQSPKDVSKTHANLNGDLWINGSYEVTLRVSKIKKIE